MFGAWRFVLIKPSKHNTVVLRIVMQEKQFFGHPKQLGSLFHRDWCGGRFGTGGF